MENEAKQWITCRFSKFLIQLCKKRRFLGGFVQKYYFFWGSCRNITVPGYCASEVLCRALFRGCAEILVLGRNIHLWLPVSVVWWNSGRGNDARKDMGGGGREGRLSFVLNQVLLWSSDHTSGSGGETVHGILKDVLCIKSWPLSFGSKKIGPN